ncbi:MAG TPA: hypothetical protein VL443_06345 [Cyclobacteriaceae bacterium]|jgi:hypothetical protein|nr:hypothetical protein [Cyclobacteriaceae bacterium]
MAFQVLTDPSKNAVSESIGSALSTGLQNLVSHKLNAIQEQKQRQQTMTGLQALGYNAQQAAQLAHLDPQSLQQVVKQKLAEPGEQAYAQALGSLLGNQQPNMAQEQQVQPEPGINLNAKQKLQLKKYLESPKAKAAHSPEELQKYQSYLNRPEPVVKQPAQAKAPSLKGLNAKQATELAKLGLDQQKLARKDRLEARAESKEFREKLRERTKAAKETLESLDRFEELEKEGLPGAGYVEFLKNSGLDIPALVGAPAEEYNKIAANFIRGAKAVFGARLTDTDVEQFLKTVPSLSNSPEGRKRINANLKRIAQLEVLESDSAKEIIKANGGEIPFDFAEKVDDLVDKKRESVYKQFKKDLQKPVPKGESALATSLLSGAGKLVGRFPKAALGAGAGAVAGGRYAGPTGAVLGGIGGGLAGLAGLGIKDFI